MAIIASIREALEESQVVVAESLTSSLGFQVDPQLLVIDELHFVLRPAAITFDQGKTLRGNVIEPDRRLLLEQQKTPGALKKEGTLEGISGSLPVTVRRYQFPPPNPPRDLLKAMYGVHAADEFSVTYREEDSKLTFYYNQDPETGPQVFGSALEGPVAQSLLLWTELLQGARRTVSPHSGSTERLYKDFAGSPYLELLHNLREMILPQLVGPRSEFQDVAGNPFI